jgi:integrase
MPKFTKRKDGRVQTDITVNGTRIYFYASNDRELRQKVMAYQQQADEGPLFEDVATEWWGQKQGALSPNSLRNYSPAVDRAVQEFGGKRIRKITPASVEEYINRFGLTHAAKTTATQLNIINQIMRYARMHGYTDTVPTDIVQVPRGLKKTPRLLPPESDVEAVRRNIDYPIMGLFAYVLLYSGLRRGEALALQYRDIDRSAKKIHVEKSLCAYRNDPFIKTPKTEAGYRDVPLVDAIMQVIPTGKPTDYIFLRDGHLLTDADFDTLWGQYQRHTGITSTPHQLRHWFATLLFDAGIDKFEAARYMGHTTTQMTEIYTHITRSRTASSLDRLNQTIGSL